MGHAPFSTGVIAGCVNSWSTAHIYKHTTKFSAFPVPLNYINHMGSTRHQQVFDPTRNWGSCKARLKWPKPGAIRRSILLPLSSSNPNKGNKSKHVVFQGHLMWGFNSHLYQNEWWKCSSPSMTPWLGRCRVKGAAGAHSPLSSWGCSPGASDSLPPQVASWRFPGSAWENKGI